MCEQVLWRAPVYVVFKYLSKTGEVFTYLCSSKVNLVFLQPSLILLNTSHSVSACHRFVTTLHVQYTFKWRDHSVETDFMQTCNLPNLTSQRPKLIIHSGVPQVHIKSPEHMKCVHKIWARKDISWLPDWRWNTNTFCNHGKKKPSHLSPNQGADYSPR